MVVVGGGGRGGRGGGRRRGGQEERRGREVCVRRTLAASLSPAPHSHTPPANPHVNITILFFLQNHACGFTYISDVTETRVSGSVLCSEVVCSV